MHTTTSHISKIHIVETGRNIRSPPLSELCAQHFNPGNVPLSPTQYTCMYIYLLHVCLFATLICNNVINYLVHMYKTQASRCMLMHDCQASRILPSIQTNTPTSHEFNSTLQVIALDKQKQVSSPPNLNVIPLQLQF